LSTDIAFSSIQVGNATGDFMKRIKEHQVREEKKRHQSFVEVQNTCPLCNDQLTIRVESYLENDMLREEASCPTCQILTRVRNHKMH
jgi:hypothetical protein